LIAVGVRPVARAEWTAERVAGPADGTTQAQHLRLVLGLVSAAAKIRAALLVAPFLRFVDWIAVSESRTRRAATVVVSSAATYLFRSYGFGELLRTCESLAVLGGGVQALAHFRRKVIKERERIAAMTRTTRRWPDSDRRYRVTADQPFTEPIEMARHLSGCPYDAYARLREAGGAHQAVRPGGGYAWVISRYADVKALLSDPRMSLETRHSRNGYEGFGLPPALEQNLLNVDDQAHARMRRLVSCAFTPRRVEAQQERVQAVVDRLITAIAPNGHADLLSEFAAPAPLIVSSANCSGSRSRRAPPSRPTPDR
jgi:hypothetical protein